MIYKPNADDKFIFEYMTTIHNRFSGTTEQFFCETDADIDEVIDFCRARFDLPMSGDDGIDWWQTVGSVVPADINGRTGYLFKAFTPSTD